MTIVFLKHFNATRQTLSGIGNTYVRRANKVSDLIPIVKEKMKWSPETQLKLYEVTTCALSSTRRADPQSFPRKSNLA